MVPATLEAVWTKLDAWLVSQERSSVAVGAAAAGASAVAIGMVVLVPRPGAVVLCAGSGALAFLLATVALLVTLPAHAKAVSRDEFEKAAGEVNPAEAQSHPDPKGEAVMSAGTLALLDQESARADERRLTHARHLTARGQQVLTFAAVAAGAASTVYSRSDGDHAMAVLLGTNLLLFALTAFCALGDWRLTEHQVLLDAQGLQQMAYADYYQNPQDFQAQLVALRAEAARRSKITDGAKTLWARLAMSALAVQVLHLLALIAVEPYL